MEAPLSGDEARLGRLFVAVVGGGVAVAAVVAEPSTAWRCSGCCTAGCCSIRPESSLGKGKRRRMRDLVKKINPPTKNIKGAQLLHFGA